MFDMGSFEAGHFPFLASVEHGVLQVLERWGEAVLILLKMGANFF